MTRVWVLHNTRAGPAPYHAALGRAAEALARRGVSVQLVQSDDMVALRAAAREATAEGADAVLVAGGDGTTGTLAGELAGSRTALGCLPAGTANVWARELGLPRPLPWLSGSFERVALQLLDAPVRLTDLGRCDDRWFLAWAGVGLDAYVAQQFELRREQSRRMGGFYYKVALTFDVARAWQAIDLSVRVTGPAGTREMAGRYLMTTVANIGLHGGGLFRFTRALCLDDGLMDVWAFAGETYGDMLALAGRVLVGRHVGHPRIVRLTGDHVEITLAAPQVIHLDAEPQPLTRRMVVDVVPRALRLLVPSRSAEALYSRA